MVPGGLNNNSKQAQAQGSQDFYDYLWSRLSEEGEAENAVQDNTGYKKNPLKEDTSLSTFTRVDVGGSTLPGNLPPALERVSRTLPDGPRKLWELLQNLAHDLLPANRETRRKVSVVVFEIPLELLGAHLKVHPDTVRRWKLFLISKGLLAATYRVVKTPEGLRRTGTVWAVPVRPGARPKVDPRDFEHLPHRNLWQDKQGGALSFNWVKQGAVPSYEALLLWSRGVRLAPRDKLLPLEAIFTLPSVPRGEASRLITLLSHTLAKALDDAKSRRFFAKVLWEVHRGAIPVSYLFGLLQNLIEGYRAGEISRPGAVLVHSLKKHGVPLDP